MTYGHMTERDIISITDKARGGIMYGYIREWEAWWRGKNSSFHEYLENGVSGRPIRRELYRMNMAKKICEDWAAVLLNDTTAIVVGDETGNSFVERIFSETDFIRQANRLIEKAFAVGTGAAILRLNGCIDTGEGLRAGEKTAISFEFVDAAHIIPLSVKNGRITEAAFLSEGISRGQPYSYLEIHTLEEDGYVIRNLILESRDGSYEVLSPTELEVSEGECVEVIRTGSPYPFFSIISPNTVNHIDEGSGLGISVFADAVDCLKGVDLAFNNFCRDIKLGGKKVFINQSLVRRDEGGCVYAPDDVAQQLFVTVGDTDISVNPMITEHNPELRTSDNTEAVQAQLDYLSFRCGLGSHHYTFGGISGRTKLTATQYVGERQDMLQNAVKHQKSIEAFIRGTVRVLLWCAVSVCGVNADVNAPISVIFDDTYFTDTESQRARDLRELEAGVITTEEYRSRWIQ